MISKRKMGKKGEGPAELRTSRARVVKQGQLRAKIPQVVQKKEILSTVASEKKSTGSTKEPSLQESGNSWSFGPDNPELSDVYDRARMTHPIKTVEVKLWSFVLVASLRGRRYLKLVAILPNDLRVHLVWFIIGQDILVISKAMLFSLVFPSCLLCCLPIYHVRVDKTVSSGQMATPSCLLAGERTCSTARK